MLTALAKSDYNKANHSEQKSRKDLLLEEFSLFEKSRVQQLTNQKIWQGIDTDDDAYKATNEEIENLLLHYKKNKI